MNEAIIHRISLQRLRPAAPSSSKESPDLVHRRAIALVVAETARGVRGYGEVALAAADEPDDAIDRVMGAVLGPNLVSFHPKSFPEALESIESLPFSDDHGRPIHPVRAAVENALLDLCMRVFERDADATVQWMGLPGFGSPGSMRRAIPAIVLPLLDGDATKRFVRRHYWRGYRHFKMPVRGNDDDARLDGIVQYLARAVDRDKATLRVNARGSWSKDQAVEWLSDHVVAPIAAIEDPLPHEHERDLPVLRDLFDVAIFCAESIGSSGDAHRLVELGAADGLQIDVARCGGFMAALRIASFARRERVRLSVGIPFGASDVSLGIASRLLQVCPGIEWVDVEASSRPARWRLGRRRIQIVRTGRGLPDRRPGWGLEVEERRLRRFAVGDRIVWQF